MPFEVGLCGREHLLAARSQGDALVEPEHHRHTGGQTLVTGQLHPVTDRRVLTRALPDVAGLTFCGATPRSSRCRRCYDAVPWGPRRCLSWLPYSSACAIRPTLGTVPWSPGRTGRGPSRSWTISQIREGGLQLTAASRHLPPAPDHRRHRRIHDHVGRRVKLEIPAPSRPSPARAGAHWQVPDDLLALEAGSTSILLYRSDIRC